QGPAIIYFSYNFAGQVFAAGGAAAAAPNTRAVSDPRPGVPATVYTLDAYGATTEIDAPLGQKTMMTWAMDHPDPAAVPDPRLQTPGLDVLMLSKTDALGRTTSYRYDALGNVIQETIDTSTITGGAIQPVQGANGGQITTKYTYDPLFSKMTSKTDASGNTTFYVLDSRLPFSADTGTIPALPAGVSLPAPATVNNTGDLLAVVDALAETTKT